MLGEYMDRKILKILIALFLISFSAVVVANEQVEINFYYSNGCPHCVLLSNHLDFLQEKYGESIVVNKINANLDFPGFIEIQNKYGVPKYSQGGVPKVFIQDFFCSGDTPCIESIEPELLKLGVVVPLEENQGAIQGDGNVSNSPENEEVIDTNDENNGVESGDVNSSVGNVSNLPVNENTGINYWQLLGLALVDAVNPCEIAVLTILMLSILTREPEKKGKALKIGLAFSLGIFLMYFLFGFLIILGFKSIIGLTNLSGSWFYSVLGVLAILIGLLNLKDAIWYGGGGFILEVPLSWRPKMKRIINETKSIRGAFITGLIVSFFLTPCTAGPYFVAGGILSAVTWFEAIIPLLFYLCIFISPMVLVTLIVYIGFVAVEDLSGWREKNVKLLHLVAGILLVGLGIAMLLGWI